MPIEIIKTDITTMAIDAIVNAANNSLAGGGGVDGAIHAAAGKEFTQYCIGLRGCNTGFAKITPGFLLPAKYVIHTVGPVWNNGTQQEEELLANCYKNSLALAIQNNLITIAFPCISTGAYRFPFQKAAAIALHSINKFLIDNPAILNVYLVVFNDKDYKQYQKVYASTVIN
jgi:O-acetyl-ADP-ribose deacetylase